MEKLRLSLLAVIFGSVFFVLGRTILTPTVGNSTMNSFVFPTDVPLPEWQLDVSRPLAARIAESPNYPSGRHYKYIKNGLTLDIEMRHVLNTNGDVKYFIHQYSSMPPPPGQPSLVLRQQEGVGFYNLFAYQQRAYLSTCINSRGGSTVTESQFRLNRYTYDIRFNSLVAWALGRANLVDGRCLWAHLSIPLQNSSQTDAYQTLEKAWFDWYQWWYPRFPKS